MVKQIATFLQLPNVHLYTGHCFRRTSATLLAASGASATDLQQHGGCKSIQVATGYIEDSIHTKSKRGSLISKSINLPSTSKDSNEILNSEVPMKKAKIDENPTNATNSIKQIEPELVSDVLNKSFLLQNCNVTINIYQK
ncbi:uncharacterized protein LOC122499774 [Leptopilina heterotoma]|uniref:uncharacterized protein LOC122499774 n=1 Tax=Leptopilina heterotoma TaxID=63436 RepID=UPI001CA93BA1|nr:uncharacterized protein LOC122499774 [Leptopilina heterotoma]